jgi:signal transduction histidine kinase
MATWVKSSSRDRPRLRIVVRVVANSTTYLSAVLLVVISTAPVQFLAVAWFIFVVTSSSRASVADAPPEPSTEPSCAQHESILHDLSNAMTASVFMVRDLRRVLEKGSEPNLQRALRLSQDLAVELSQMSDHINASRQSVRLQLTAGSPVSLIHPVQQCVEHVSRLYPDVTCRVQCDLPEDQAYVSIVGGTATLKRIVENLVINACQAQSAVQDKQVECRIRLIDGAVAFSVSDNGPGFPQAVIDAQPSPFVSTKSNGSGIGLYSCHQLVKRDGGTLSISSGATGGACVTVTWPQVRTAADGGPRPLDSKIMRSGTRTRPSDQELDAKIVKGR